MISGGAVAASSDAAGSAAKANAAEAAVKAVTRLPVAAALAFGLDGLADGDNPGNARYALSGGASQPWSTQWYSTPQFGMLKHGTGLLLDLGGKVTVTSVVIDLGKYRGADLQIRVGNGTAPQDLRVAATASKCRLPKNAITYPVTLPAAPVAPTAVKLYNAAAATGLGPSTVTLTAKLSVAPNSYNGVYSSTWTFSLISGP